MNYGIIGRWSYKWQVKFLCIGKYFFSQLVFNYTLRHVAIFEDLLI